MTTYIGIPKCSHCGDAFVRVAKDQRYCIPCGVSVALQIAADEKRRTRFEWSKPMDGWRPNA